MRWTYKPDCLNPCGAALAAPHWIPLVSFADQWNIDKIPPIAAIVKTKIK